MLSECVSCSAKSKRTVESDGYADKNENNDSSSDTTTMASAAVDVDSVSDAEALLACHAYLVRKKRLDWTAAAERQQRRMASWPQSAGGGALLGGGGSNSSRAVGTQPLDPNVGFFWEDPSQLPYLSRNRIPRRGLGDVDSDNDDDATAVVDQEEQLSSSGSSTEWEFAPLDDAFDDYAGRKDPSEEGIWETVIHSPDTARQVMLPVDDDDDDDDDGYENDEVDNDVDEQDADSSLDEFAAIDGTPSPSHVRRSQAVQRRWSDPVWKAQWYEKRWGNKKQRTSSSKDHKAAAAAARRVRRLDPDRLLASAEMSALTPAEIEHAIRTYVESRHKRRLSRQRTRRQRQEAGTIPKNNNNNNNNNNMATTTANKKKNGDDDDSKSSSVTGSSNRSIPLPRDALLQPDRAQLEQARRQRSERSKRAYQTRLMRQRQNQKQPKGPALSGTSTETGHVAATTREQPPPPRTTTATTAAEAALQRVERQVLQIGGGGGQNLPSIADVECLLQPSRLARRKLVLRLILSECFDLRGKCIPARLALADKKNTKIGPAVGGEGEEERFLFVTTCSINVIGAFVLEKLRQAHNHANEQDNN